MKKIKKYTQAEIRALVITHNLLVHSCYIIDDSTMSRLILDGYQDQNLVLPYYAIPFQETLSGHSERVYLEWDKVTETITIAGIEIILELNKYLKSINITCNKIGNIYGDADTIFGDVNTVDGTVNLNVTGDVLGEVLSNIIYKSEIHLKRK